MMAEQAGYVIDDFCIQLEKQEHGSLDFFTETYPKLTAGS